MNRGEPLRRTVGLARPPVPLPRKPLRRTPMARQRAEAGQERPGRGKAGDWTPEVRAALLARSGGACEIAVPGVCTGQATDAHHRQARRSRRHDVVNGIACCRSCHGAAHRQPALAMHMGWIVSQYVAPETAPVNIRGEWWLFLEDGGRERTGAPL